LLHAAGAKKARLLVLAIDEPEKANQMLQQVRHHYPHLKILARAHSLQHAHELLRLGADQVFRETFDAALDLSMEALKSLGFRAYQAQRAARLFKKHETQAIVEMHGKHRTGERVRTGYADRPA
jgi:voltage-gated potassium channel Kch